MLKIAVFAPIPSASVTMATALKVQSLRIMRSAYRASLAQFGEEGTGTNTASVVFDGIHASDLHQRRPPRRLGRQTGGDLLVHEHVDVGVNVGSKLRIAAAAAEQVADQRRQPAEGRTTRRHDVDPSACSIAMATRRQFASSTCICFLPSRVRR